MNATKRPPLSPGDRVIGKWSRQEWTVQAQLGVGANGAVYSVRGTDGALYAMKVCDDVGAVAFEWGLLEQLNATGFAFPKPHCIDDSATHPALYFYVMEQIEGRPLDQIWKKLSSDDMKRVLLGVGYGLRALHKSQHAFCDVKPQNLLVDVQSNQCVRFVDVGGVTPFGRSVRQFTPTSDPAYWGFGERRACARYDIEAVALMVATLFEPVPQGLPQWPVERRQAWILRSIRGRHDKSVGALLEDAMRGRIDTADEFVRRLYALKLRPTGFPKRSAAKAQTRASRSAAAPGNGRRPAPSQPRPQQRSAKARKRSADWTERLMWWALTCAVISTAGAWAEYLR
ncbi:protein kinase domain-containing protein [Alicyclobacillus fastidiosus]|uniref:Phosphotransferase n=1 Tax=Alicyclobacillus fastidiosus TaxID=392011 RepID=A0ABV5ADW5_9BACL|nr:phosphotransferase [Alicyclobacillus fastidiosus]WEH09948.1 phosphotransferase [Alicyclobacillus fastidiosus]